jgi:hypothetical protein
MLVGTKTRSPEGDGLNTRALLAALALGAAALLILGIQPLLYGAYVREGLLDEQALGLLSAIEVAAIASGSALAVTLLRRFGTRWIGVCSIAVMVLTNLLTPHTGAALEVFATRAVCGLGEGLAVGIVAAAIARVDQVARWTGGFLLAQAGSQFAVMQGFALAGAEATSSVVQNTLLGCAVACLLAVPLLPQLAGPAGAEDGATSGQPPRAGVVGLAAMALFVGGAVGIWAYAGLWLESRGVSATRSTTVLAASLAGQMLGALIATIWGDGRCAWLRLSAMIVLLVTATIGWMASPDSLVLAFVFGLIWQAGTPALASVLVELDPSRRALPFAAAAQLAGIALLPAAFGLVLGEGRLDRLVAAFMVPIALSLFLVLSQLRLLLRRSPVIEAVAAASKR